MAGGSGGEFAEYCVLRGFSSASVANMIESEAEAAQSQYGGNGVVFHHLQTSNFAPTCFFTAEDDRNLPGQGG
jgi:hypothetical protein